MENEPTALFTKRIVPCKTIRESNTAYLLGWFRQDNDFLAWFGPLRTKIMLHRNRMPYLVSLLTAAAIPIAIASPPRLETQLGIAHIGGLYSFFPPQIT